MAGKSDRITYAKGTPGEIGLAAGRRLGKRLAKNISYYIRNRPLRPEALDRARMQSEAMLFLRSLPARFQDEIAGLAEGAGLPLQQVAEWFAIEHTVHDGCSGFTSVIGGHTWVGRNNDFRAPAVWGYVSVKNIKDRIPTITFGMEADVFTATGINREQLWLHSQYLPVSDAPRMSSKHLPGYVKLTEALETCGNIREVENLLAKTDRSDGMILFAVDGKTEEAVIFECSCRKCLRRDPVEYRLIATNHARNTKPNKIIGSSALRFARLSELVGKHGWAGAKTPDTLIATLADDRVEQRDYVFITVEAAVACPAKKKIWYTLGGYPAASSGNWRQIDWPW